MNIKVRDKKYNFSHTKFYQGKICAMYNCSRSVEIHSFLSYLSGSGDVMFEREYISHGSLVLVSRQMLPNSRTRTCSISKFPPYNLGQHAIFFLQLSYSCLQLPNIGQG